jgi:hypothetical protein
MLDDSRWILDHPRTVKEEAHKENTSASSGQSRRLSRPFSRTIIAQQEKNKRDRQFRDHFSREKKLEQQRLEKQIVTYEKTMALAKGGSISIGKAPKHAKKASNAFFRVVRPLSTAFPFSYNTTTALPTRQWSLSELDFNPTNKPSLSINLAAARTKRLPERRVHMFSLWIRKTMVDSTSKLSTERKWKGGSKRSRRRRPRQPKSEGHMLGQPLRLSSSRDQGTSVAILLQVSVQFAWVLRPAH